MDGRSKTVLQSIERVTLVGLDLKQIIDAVSGQQFGQWTLGEEGVAGDQLKNRPCKKSCVS